MSRAIKPVWTRKKCFAGFKVNVGFGKLGLLERPVVGSSATHIAVTKERAPK